MAKLPAFIRNFQGAFNKALDVFIAERMRFANNLDSRLNEHVRRALQTLDGGKRLRPLLISLGYEAAGGKNTKTVFPAGISLEFFHSFALIHDDIIDRSTLRRGRKTIHRVVAEKTSDQHAGLATALLSGDLMFAVADQFDRIPVPATRREAARRAFHQMAEETVLGQQLEFDLSRTRRMQVEDIVRAMMYKSGRYSIEWPLRIGAILAGAPDSLQKRFTRFSIPLGLSFQLRDDILGVFGNPATTGKSHDSDLREGKATLLIAFTDEASSTSERKLLNRTLGNPHAKSKDIAEVRNLIRRSGALERAQRLARDLTHTGIALLERSGFRTPTQRKLRDLAAYLLERDS